MAETKTVKNFVINKVESREVFDYMINNGLVSEDEFYLVEGDDCSVLYTEQHLTEEQKAQARENIGASSETVLPDINALIYDAIYGIVDGTVESVVNGKAIRVRDYALYKHEMIRSVDFSVATVIGDYSFYKCNALTNVNVPIAENIGAFAFKGCSSLPSIDFPRATVIGQGAFDECASLTNVSLPNAVQILPLTFRKCTALTTVDLPVATSIGTQAFYHSGVALLTLRSDSICTLESADALYFTPIEEGAGFIYVPSNLVNSYKSADGWSVYANQIKAIV